MATMVKVKALLAKLCANTIKTKDITFSGKKTIPSSGELRLATPEETGLQNKVVVGIFIASWVSNSGAINVALGSGNSIWIIGASGAWINTVVVRLSYIG